jgi:hypothetical protein
MIFPKISLCWFGGFFFEWGEANSAERKIEIKKNGRNADRDLGFQRGAGGTLLKL